MIDVGYELEDDGVFNEGDFDLHNDDDKEPMTHQIYEMNFEMLMKLSSQESDLQSLIESHRRAHWRVRVIKLIWETFIFLFFLYYGLIILIKP